MFSIENLASTDTTRLDAFMDALFQLRAEKVLSPEQSKAYDSLMSLKPLQRITINDIGGQSYELKIFPLQKRRSIVIAKRNEDIIELSVNVITDIFRKKSYFLSK
jgi:hypothetical protein